MKRETQCIICGSHGPLYRAKGVCLCGRCILALRDALGDKLPPPKP